MSRVSQPVLRRCVWLACAALAVVALASSSAWAQNQISFGVRPRYNGIPNAGSNLVFYNLPASGSVYAGPVNAAFDLTALVSGTGTETASGFGLIGTVGGTGQVVFNPPVAVGDENTLGNAQNTAFPINSSFDLRFANTGIQGGGTQEVDIVAIEEVALQNNTVTNGDGIASIPVQIAGGATGTFNVAFNVSTNYTGFVKTISQNETQFLTNPGSFPHVGGTIEVRESRRADLNGDSLVDGEDIAPFVSALLNTSSFQASNPWLQTFYISDFNQDQAIDGEDIQGFVNTLLGIGGSPVGSPAAVPEPCSLLLCVVGIGGLAIARRHLRRR